MCSRMCSALVKVPSVEAGAGFHRGNAVILLAANLNINPGSFLSTLSCIKLVLLNHMQQIKFT